MVQSGTVAPEVPKFVEPYGLERLLFVSPEEGNHRIEKTGDERGRDDVSSNAGRACRHVGARSYSWCCSPTWYKAELSRQRSRNSLNRTGWNGSFLSRRKKATIGSK